MASEVLQLYLRGELRSELTTAVRAAAQESVMRRLVDEQIATDVKALIGEINTKLPAISERIAQLDEIIAQGTAEVTAKRLEKSPLLAQLDEANVRADRVLAHRAQEAINAAERRINDMNAAMNTDKSRRETAMVQQLRLTNALAQLQPMLTA